MAAFRRKPSNKTQLQLQRGLLDLLLNVGQRRDVKVWRFDLVVAHNLGLPQKVVLARLERLGLSHHAVSTITSMNGHIPG